jgi:pantoate--beta-alanine ligase
MRVIHSLTEMSAWSKDQALSGLTIGLVPTMGFFHEGHLSLMRAASGMADKVIVSLFVNPIQFGPGEDFEAYPRNFEHDCTLAGQEGADVVFAPDVAEMYSDGFQTTVSVGSITQHLCGAGRPGHFDGVATVLTKLFHVTRADKAIFGEKDYQQLAVIRRMVIDLDMDIGIYGHPIVREADGLAMSSRNSYLDKEERGTALCLYESLVMARENAASGIMETSELAGLVGEHILSFSGTEIDYVSFVDNRTLEPVAKVDENTLLALAVKINNKVRLIDNCLVLAEQEAF